EHQPKDDTASRGELGEKSLRTESAKGQRGHHTEFADGEERDEAERVHAAQIGFAIGDVHCAPKHARSEGSKNAVHRICAGSVRTGRSNCKNCCAHTHDQSAAQNTKPATHSSTAKLVEEKKTPEDAEERI